MEDSTHSDIHECRYRDDPIFGPLCLLFRNVGTDIVWQATGKHDKNHKVWVTWKNQLHAVGFAHELAVLSPEKFIALLDIYFANI